MNDQVTEDQILEAMINTLDLLRRGKPEERSEKARRYAVTLTEMEKVFAYFKVYVDEFIYSSD